LLLPATYHQDQPPFPGVTFRSKDSVSIAIFWKSQAESTGACGAQIVARWNFRKAERNLQDATNQPGSNEFDGKSGGFFCPKKLLSTVGLFGFLSVFTMSQVLLVV
jgi:hypothetical protein